MIAVYLAFPQAPSAASSVFQSTEQAVILLRKLPLAAFLDADLITFSPHKIGGPRGVGVLVRHRPVVLDSPLSAGRQEHGLRGGTEDVAAAAVYCWRPVWW